MFPFTATFHIARRIAALTAKSTARETAHLTDQAQPLHPSDQTNPGGFS
jgi:hypothetical protein